jgi:hypothetical protein
MPPARDTLARRAADALRRRIRDEALDVRHLDVRAQLRAHLVDVVGLRPRYADELARAPFAVTPDGAAYPLADVRVGMLWEAADDDDPVGASTSAMAAARREGRDPYRPYFLAGMDYPHASIALADLLLVRVAGEQAATPHLPSRYQTPLWRRRAAYLLRVLFPP